MSRTIVEIYLPWTFADEGTYRVSLDNTLATVWIKYFPSKGRLGEVTGLFAATNRLYPDDPFGIVNFSFIMIEIPFLLVAEVPLTILGSLIYMTIMIQKSSERSPQFVGQIQEYKEFFKRGVLSKKDEATEQ